MIIKNTYIISVLICCFSTTILHGQSENSRITITPIDQVNSDFVEANVYVTADRKKLYFMSTRGGETWNNMKYTRVHGKFQGDGDLYMSTRTSEGWTEAKNMGNDVNTPQAQDEPICDPQGRLTVFESWFLHWPKSKGPYYKMNHVSGRLKSLHPAITAFFIANKFSATDGATLSPDGRWFIFAAGPELDQNMDLYGVKVDDPTATVEKLSLSTQGDERAPYWSPDGRALYYATDHLNGLGKLDIYKAPLNGSNEFELETVLNIGAPINSPEDDRNFVISQDGDWAYMIRNDDIYEIDFSSADSKLKPQPVLNNSNSEQDHKTIKIALTFYWNEDKATHIDPSVIDSLENLNSAKSVNIVAMASSEGTVAYNYNLAQKRANFTKYMLSLMGYNKKRITTTILGESKSDQSKINDSDRRVEIYIEQ